MNLFNFAILLFMLLVINTHAEEVKAREKTEARQMEYISLINALLQSTNALSTFDGALLAFTTILSSLVTRMKPFMMASALSYLIYVATAIFVPGPLAKMGLPTMAKPELSPKARSLGSSNSTMSKIFDGIVADTVMRSINISPVKTILTNVSVTVITESMSRVRSLSRMLVQQLSMFQGRMSWFSRSLSNECVSRFLCRVGQFTETNFPMASTVLRSLANLNPNLDEFATAVVRGTSSSSCSLIYPDCTA